MSTNVNFSNFNTEKRKKERGRRIYKDVIEWRILF